MSSDTKIQIWKQFTTIRGTKIKNDGCVIRYKDTNLKAIHNAVSSEVAGQQAVSSDTKIQIWKQFTTSLRSLFWRSLLCHPIQRYKFESNSQLIKTSARKLGCCVIRYKDTNLKAIHNSIVPEVSYSQAVSSDTKIQIWKQFTTTTAHLQGTWGLCHPIQRYKFESNSQPRLSAMRDCLCCVIRYKDTNLKAIHNPQQSARAVPAAVSSDTKIQIWKQFTTWYGHKPLKHKLCHPIQRYKFESNSQLSLS